MRLPTRAGNRRPAAALIEFAFVIPIFFLFLIGVLEYARFLFTLQLLNNAAREGARYAAVNTTAATTLEVQNYVDGYLAGQGAKQLTSYTPGGNITVYRADPVTGANLGASWENSSWGDAVGVMITGTYLPMMPGLTGLSSSMTLKGVCVITCEAN